MRTFRDRYPQVELVLKEICTNQQLELAAAWKREQVSPVLQKFLQIVREIANSFTA